MMTVRSALFTAAFACAAVCATAADAQLGKPTESRPVVENDLVGKKICWTPDGAFTMFGSGGQFTNSAGNHLEWSVTEPGVVKIGDGYHQIQILPDGSFYQHAFAGGAGSITGHSEWWGNVCK